MLLPVRVPTLSLSRSNQPGFAGTSATTIPGLSQSHLEARCEDRRLLRLSQQSRGQ
jgi:hypothetical protein